jgi:hypothetical protein
MFSDLKRQHARFGMAPYFLRNLDLYLTVNLIIPSSYEDYVVRNPFSYYTSTTGSEVYGVTDSRSNAAGFPDHKRRE